MPDMYHTPELNSSIILALRLTDCSKSFLEQGAARLILLAASCSFHLGSPSPLHTAISTHVSLLRKPPRGAQGVALKPTALRLRKINKHRDVYKTPHFGTMRDSPRRVIWVCDRAKLKRKSGGCRRTCCCVAVQLRWREGGVYTRRRAITKPPTPKFRPKLKHHPPPPATTPTERVLDGQLPSQ